MNWKRAATRLVSEACSLARKRNAPRAGSRILLYHAVGTRLAHDRYGISINPRLFESHMDILSSEAQNFHLAAFDDTQNSATALRRVTVTFDDGYRDNLHVAAPVLLRRNIPFTVFVTSSFIGKTSDNYLSVAELKELSALSNVTIGAHGATHIRLAECDDATLQKELSESRRRLEDFTGRAVTNVSYPHGSVNLRVRAAAAEAGYTTGGCSRFDINEEKRDRLLLNRCEIIAADSERIFKQKLYGAWDWYRWRSADPASH
jgi:peptidoglycan/xylan/chitin deacetylase (PgdA/CDA1 family)